MAYNPSWTVAQLIEHLSKEPPEALVNFRLHYQPDRSKIGTYFDRKIEGLLPASKPNTLGYQFVTLLGD